VILGLPHLDLAARFEIEQFGERSVLGGVEILLHQAKRDARAARELARELHRGGGNLGGGNDAFGDAERERPAICGEA